MLWVKATHYTVLFMGIALTSPHKGWYTSLTVESVMSYSSIETGFSLLFIALAATKADGFALYFLGECNNVSIYI